MLNARGRYEDFQVKVEVNNESTSSICWKCPRNILPIMQEVTESQKMFTSTSAGSTMQAIFLYLTQVSSMCAPIKTTYNPEHGITARTLLYWRLHKCRHRFTFFIQLNHLHQDSDRLDHHVSDLCTQHQHYTFMPTISIFVPSLPLPSTAYEYRWCTARSCSPCPFCASVGVYGCWSEVMLCNLSFCMLVCLASLCY